MPPTSTLARRGVNAGRPSTAASSSGVTTPPGFLGELGEHRPLLVAEGDLGGPSIGERRGIRRVDHGDDRTNAPFHRCSRP